MKRVVTGVGPTGVHIIFYSICRSIQYRLYNILCKTIFILESNYYSCVMLLILCYIVIFYVIMLDTSCFTCYYSCC